MTDLTNGLKYQGKHAKAIYNYQATMNDEVSLTLSLVFLF